MSKDGYVFFTILVLVYAAGFLTGRELSLQNNMKCVKVEAVKKPYERCFVLE